MIFPIKRKTLPEIAKVVGLDQSQIFSHNISLGSERTEKAKVRFNLRTLKGRKFLIIDAGDKKKGKRTDYVSRQYLGSWER